MTGELILNLLMNETMVTDEVADRIFPIIVPQNQIFPAITYEMVGNETIQIKGFQKIADTVSVQINVFAKSYPKVSTIAQAIKTALDFKHSFTINDIDVCSIIPENELDGVYNETVNIFHRILKYEISINQPYTL